MLTSAWQAELIIPAIIGGHMVLQQKQSDRIWGWAAPGTKITVIFAGQNYSTAGGLFNAMITPLEPSTVAGVES